ncbi:MAG TPA: ion channel [Rhizomicrobium sp.]|nr:ion channel [Rhizomicrobium sp.]
MSEGGGPRPVSLIRNRRSARVGIIKGQDAGRFLDFYHGILTASWPGFVVRLAALFLVVNLVFAILYVTDRGGITNARPGSFADAFFFSVQTLGTLGYGVMAPRTIYTNILVTAESFAGILIIALFAGMIFARFSRPFARVVFSRSAVVTTFDGALMLMFRAANQRGNSILDASATVSLASNYVTREGDRIRRFQELRLVRSSNPLFALSWTVMHPINETRPLYNLGMAEMIERDMQIVVMLSGMDETISDRIYARYSYVPEEILWHHRFVDVISVTPGGQRLVDLVRFHDTEAISPEGAEQDEV